MKILVAGSFFYPLYEVAFADALSRLGHEVHRFGWSRFFSGSAGKLQAYFPLPGPALLQLNHALARQADHLRPDVLLVWRGTHVLPVVLRRIRTFGGITIATYNNDDPFARVGGFKWFWCKRSYSVADLSLFYRPVNVDEAQRSGARRAAVMMPYFIPMKDRPLPLSDGDLQRFGCDAVFVGHYEADGREKYLQALVRAGLHVRLFGGRYWTSKVLGETAAHFGSICEVLGDDYARALRAAKMSLCFLSKHNRDVYTRRCFEIPACGGLLLSERTSELKRLFLEDEEAVFFSSADELVEKARWLKNNAGDRMRIAAAGTRRVHADGHSVDDRARQFIAMVEQAKAEESVRP